MFFRKKKTTAPVAFPKTGQRLFLYIAETGWSASITDIATHEIVLEEGGPALDDSKWTTSTIESTFRIAAQKFQKRRLSDIREIRILFDDPAVLFTDSKDRTLRSGSPGKIREYGIRLLNVAACTYGDRKCNLASDDAGGRSDMDMEFASGDRPQDKIYAFADVSQVRNYLSQLEAAALKVTTLSPIGDLLLSHAAASSGTASATLYVANFNSYFALTNSRYGTAMVRVIPIGLMTLIAAIAGANSISIKDAADALAKRDFISDIKIGKSSENDAAITQTSYERSLGPLLGQFIAELTATVEFFETQRGGGRLPSIEIFGDVGRIQGFKALIDKNLEIPVKFNTTRPLSVFRQYPPQSLINLLNGSEGSLVSVGRSQYSFSKDRFVSAEELSREAVAIKQSQPARERFSRIAALRGKQGAKSSSKDRGADKDRSAAKPQGFLSRLTREKTPAVAKPGSRRSTSQRDAIGEARNDRQFFMLLGALVLGVFYLAWMQYDDLVIRHDRRVSEFSKLVLENQTLRDQIARSGTLGLQKREAESDKVLWSEKFLSIAKNLDKAMWLTDVYLSDESREVGQHSVVSKKLTLEGAVLPSVHGHILKISEYIDRLIKDEKYFMSDFRSITFEGANIDTSEEAHVVRFTIAAWYDENKRLVTKDTKSTEKKGPLANMLHNVDERNTKLESTLGAAGAHD